MIITEEMVFIKNNSLWMKVENKPNSDIWWDDGIAWNICNIIVLQVTADEQA